MSINRNPQPYANREKMLEWANGVMASREPDLLIGKDESGQPYIRRWWIIPRNEQQNLYLHEMLHSDDDRAMHDHPFANTSVVIEGSYIEHTPEGSFTRVAGDVVSRPPEALHRLELVGSRAVTLFFTGPVERQWGFMCKSGWIPAYEFIDPINPGERGRGCGEDEVVTR